MTRRRLAVVVLVAVWSLFAVACTTADPPAESTPAARAVTIRTTGCGDASRTTGSGVVATSDLVVTAAHVVIGATEVFVQLADGTESVGAVVALDTADDLALVRVDIADRYAPVQLIELSVTGVSDGAGAGGADEAGDRAAVSLIGGAASGDVDVEVLRRVLITVDEVRGTGTVQRDGYELRGAISGGDSGAGIFDADGRLGAIVFAEPRDRDGVETAATSRFFATASDGVARLIDSEHLPHTCDTDASRLIVSEAD